MGAGKRDPERDPKGLRSGFRGEFSAATAFFADTNVTLHHDLDAALWGWGVQECRVFVESPASCGVCSPIEGSVADGLVKVVRSDVRGVFEVRDCSRDAEDAIVGAGAEFERLHGLLEKCSGRLVQLAVLADEARGHPCIVSAGSFETKRLVMATTCDAVAHCGAGFTIGASGHFSKRDGRHFDLDINAVEERTGNALR